MVVAGGNNGATNGVGYMGGVGDAIEANVEVEVEVGGYNYSAIMVVDGDDGD